MGIERVKSVEGFLLHFPHEVFYKSTCPTFSFLSNSLTAAISCTCTYKPTRTRRFIFTLQNDGKLLSCYTQNFDMLEHKAGLSVGIGEQDEPFVKVHGSGNVACTSMGCKSRASQQGGPVVSDRRLSVCSHKFGIHRSSGHELRRPRRQPSRNAAYSNPGISRTFLASSSSEIKQVILFSV